jgi:IS66 C-terminal element/Transposase IS66 family
VIEVACLAHVRRKFFEARTSAPVPAHAALARIRLFYKIEAAAEGFPTEGRRAMWQRESFPLPTAAVLHSLTGTCKHHDIDPFAYLQDILGRLPSHPLERLDELLPDVWFSSHPSARRKKAA